MTMLPLLESDAAPMWLGCTKYPRLDLVRSSPLKFCPASVVEPGGAEEVLALVLQAGGSILAPTRATTSSGRPLCTKWQAMSFLQYP